MSRDTSSYAVGRHQLLRTRVFREGRRFRSARRGRRERSPRGSAGLPPGITQSSREATLFANLLPGGDSVMRNARLAGAPGFRPASPSRRERRRCSPISFPAGIPPCATLAARERRASARHHPVIERGDAVRQSPPRRGFRHAKRSPRGSAGLPPGITQSSREATLFANLLPDGDSAMRNARLAALGGPVCRAPTGRTGGGRRSNSACLEWGRCRPRPHTIHRPPGNP